LRSVMSVDLFKPAPPIAFACVEDYLFGPRAFTLSLIYYFGVPYF
jgi:hypothetical protein